VTLEYFTAEFGASHERTPDREVKSLSLKACGHQELEAMQFVIHALDRKDDLTTRAKFYRAHASILMKRAPTVSAS
jgi:hypothetical protein